MKKMKWDAPRLVLLNSYEINGTNPPPTPCNPGSTADGECGGGGNPNQANR